ncbi:MAG: hypothetical protein ACOCV7_04630 [Desulfonatronovibrionaceae bacterium]
MEAAQDIRTVRAPMTLDYPLMNSLVAQAYFNEHNQKTTLMKGDEGCRLITASSPRFGRDEALLQLKVEIALNYGRPAGNYCLFPVSFEGFLVMDMQPRLDHETWELHFDIKSSHMEKPDGSKARLASLVWKLLQDHVLTYMDDIHIDLRVPGQELEKFIREVLAEGRRQEVLQAMETFRPGQIEIQDNALCIENLIDVHEQLHVDQEPEPQVTEEQKQAFIASWETWDAFVVHMLTSLADKPLSREERLTLLDVLLGFRYAFSRELDKEVFEKDLVRKQFVQAWQKLRPVFRSHLLKDDNRSLLGYMAFFSAGDTLKALDELGPTLGLDISRQGLIRLARLISSGEVKLEYSPEVRPDLRKMLGIDEKPQKKSKGSSLLMALVGNFLWSGPLAAVASEDPRLEAAGKWIFSRDEFESYVQKTTDLIKKQAEDILENTDMPGRFHAMFRQAVLATAWQESCFRQFIIKDGQPVYIRSYNNTSVGIMQINERVWRGIYDQEKLRWDITYNAATGCGILDLYFNRYLLPRIRKNPDRNWEADVQAGVLYAMYNGGPGQLSKFLDRQKSGDLYQSDKLFREKWDWVVQDQWNKLSICLIGK